jgi:ferrochelatase
MNIAPKKLAVVLFNLGGPDSPEAVRPFLRNLFSDPAIIALPGVLRLPLAWDVARRRAPVARAIYAHMGGRSPILEETRKQARARESALGR